MQKTVENFLRKKPNYINKPYSRIAEKCGIDFNSKTIETIANAITSVGKTQNAINQKDVVVKIEKQVEEKLDIKIKKTEKETVLVIGDIHEPFCKKGYLEFCLEVYKKFNCTRVVFIGDVIDNHFSSFHDTNPDGFGAGEELERAIFKISNWVKAFPVANVIIGNHDRLAYRKAFSSGVSKKWIKEYNDVLNAPGWVFSEKITIDGVEYSHGETGTARTKAKDTGKSRVQGHLHSQAYLEWINNRTFALQVGTGVDDTQYAFAYNKDGKESILSCAVIENGDQPYLIKMK